MWQGMPMGVVSAPPMDATRKIAGKDADKASKRGLRVAHGQVTTVFVGGLRKSTTEDKVAGHFAKYGQALGLRV